MIETENPDLICLQEVDRHVARSQFDDQPRMLADYFKSAGHLFQPNVHLRAGVYGNLLLSRWKLHSRHQISLRLNQKEAARRATCRGRNARGTAASGPCASGPGERERHWQIEHLLGHHLFQESAHLPTMIVGDTNDWRNTLADGMLGLRGFRLATSPISRFRTFPAWLPLGSLDKLFVRGTVRVRHARFIRSRLPAARRTICRWWSTCIWDGTGWEA